MTDQQSSADQFPIGARVEVLGNGGAEVIGHGRGLLGDYAEVRHDDGTIRTYYSNQWFAESHSDTPRGACDEIPRVSSADKNQ